MEAPLVWALATAFIFKLGLKPNVVDLRKKVHSAQNCAEVCQPPTPKGEYILRMFKILALS